MKSFFSFLFGLPVVLFWATGFSQTFSGAEYRTKDSFLYGRFEVRMKSTPTEGTLSTFFTYFDGLPDNPWASNKWNEIDLEILGRYTNDVQFNVITPGQISHVSHIWTDFNPSDDFHVYAFEWTPDNVSFFVDSVLVRTQVASHVQTLIHPQKIMMNTWVPQWSNWVGTLDEFSLPALTWYDYVKYYEYTPGEGDYGTNNNFTHSWTDEFDEFDDVRWEKNDGPSFSGNKANWQANNIRFMDGKMILLLTLKDAAGFQDKAPPYVKYIRQWGDYFLIKFNEYPTPATALNPANYIVPGHSVESITFLGDSGTVELKVTGPVTQPVTTLFVRNIADRFSPSNILPLSSRPVTQAQPLTFPIKINVGSDTTVQGFLPDQEFTWLNDYGYQDGLTATTANPIENTTLDSVYQSYRYDLAMYRIRVPNGRYQVRLMFQESVHPANVRLFDVTIENSQYQWKDNDVAGTVGQFTRFDIVSPEITVDDKMIDIHFSSHEGKGGFLAGIEVNYLGTRTHVNSTSASPDHIRLLPNYPNPFNGTTRIPFTLKEPQDVTFIVMDVLGRIIEKKHLGFLTHQSQSIEWSPVDQSGTSLSSGLYFFYLQGKSTTPIKTMSYIK